MEKTQKPVLEPLLTVQDVCQYLKISKESLYGWIKRTDIPAHRMGKRWLFEKSALEEWIKSGHAAE